MALHDVHSCIRLASDNEKLKKWIKKLKHENNDLQQRLKNLEDLRRVEDLMKSVATRNMEVQTEPRGSYAYHPPLTHTVRRPQQQSVTSEPEKMNKMLLMHSNLMKRYEKELRGNVDHVQEITKLNLRVNELEVKLKQSEIEIHELKVGHQLTKTRKGRSKSATALKQRPRAYDASSDSEIHGLLEEFNKVRKERDKLLKEKKKMQSEVNGLDRGFFDEIEDLKYALQQSARLNKQYEKALQKLCSKFGYPFPFPEECTAKLR